MYEYKNGNKGNNVGYAKIEAKNDICKFSINVKNKTLLNKKSKVCLFYRGKNDNEKKNINLIKVSDLIIEQQEYSNSYITDTNNVFDSKVQLENIAGIILIADRENYIGTEWDDNGIDASKIRMDNIDGLKNINNGKKIILPISYESFEAQFFRATKLLLTLKKRKQKK